MKKIVVFSSDPGNHRFIEPLMEKLKTYGYEYRIINNWTAVDDADIYWFDFCDNNLISATNDDGKLLKGKMVIARLHAVEYYLNFHKQIKWEFVNNLIFVSDHMRRMCDVKGVKQTVVHNGIDLEKLSYRERRPGMVIGYAGNIVPAKGILIMFHYLRELLNRQKGYSLKMIGLNRFHGREGEYYNYYKNDLPIIEAGETNNINQWLEGVDFLWQPSLTESFSLIIGEAMAKGIKPLINDFYGSRELWPEELIYRDFSGFMKILQADYDSAKYRAWAEKYSLDKAVEKIKKEVLNDSR